MNSQNEQLSQEVHGTHQADEIDLVQLWLILLKRKYLIGSICLLCLLGGTAFTFLVPVKYKYSTTIEIGNTLVSDSNGMVSRAIEAPEVALAKLKESYIPLAVNQMMRQKDKVFFDVKASNPKGSNLIVLSSKGPVTLVESYQKLHNLVIKPLIEDHLRIIVVPRKQFIIESHQAGIKLKNLEDPRFFAIEEKKLLIEIEAAKMALIEFDEQEKLLLSQNIRLAETQDLLRQQIIKVEENLAQAHASRPKAIKKVENEAQAMTLLMISNQIEQNEKRLSGLQERLSIEIENKKEILQNNINQNNRDRALQKEKIAELQIQLTKLKLQWETDQKYQKNVISSIDNKLENLQETRILGVVVRSIKPAGPSKIVVFALSGMIGLIAGVLLAFCTEFISNAHRQSIIKMDR